jgi:phage-related protein
VIRKIIAYKNYFVNFYKAQDDKIQLKIEYVLDLVRFENRVPVKFFKQLESTDGIYEVRVITAFKSIRILCFLDEGNLVVLTNCFVKKTQKTPKKEIKKAEKLKKEYLKEKND